MVSAEQTEQNTGRHKLEAAVTKVGRAFDELVRTVEKHGQEITQDDLTKVFAFLGEVHQGSQNKALLSLSTAIAANGGFSLDSYSQSTLSVPAFTPNLAPLPVGPDGKGSRFNELVEHGGRLIGKRSKSTPRSGEDDGFLEE